MKTITITIRKYPPVDAAPAQYSDPVAPHAKEPPSCAGKKAWQGWRAKEGEHQHKNRKLIRSAVPARPATFDFTGHFRNDQEPEIIRQIFEKFGTDLAKYPNIAQVEVP